MNLDEHYENYKIDGAKLRGLRLAARLTQAGLAKELSVSVATVKKWEGGKGPIEKIKWIAIDTVIKRFLKYHYKLKDQ